MSAVQILALAIVIALGVMLVAVLLLSMHLTPHRGVDAEGGDPAGKHLAKLSAQRDHVERLADRLEHEKTNNNFRLRVERALRGQV